MMYIVYTYTRHVVCTNVLICINVIYNVSSHLSNFGYLVIATVPDNQKQTMDRPIIPSRTI